MSAVISLNDFRVGRGLHPIDPETAFGPPRGKRIGDKVRLADGRIGFVTGYRPNPGRSATLFVTAGTASLAVDADAVVASV
jgi:hypothetical protein